MKWGASIGHSLTVADVLHVTNGKHIGNSLLKQYCLYTLNLHPNTMSSSIGSGIITKRLHSLCPFKLFQL